MSVDAIIKGLIPAENSIDKRILYELSGEKLNESDFNDDTSFEDENDEIIKQKGDQNDKDDGNISFYEQQSRARLLERNSSVNSV